MRFVQINHKGLILSNLDKNIHNYPSDDISIGGGGQPGNWQDNPHFFQLGGRGMPPLDPALSRNQMEELYW